MRTRDPLGAGRAGGAPSPGRRRRAALGAGGKLASGACLQPVPVLSPEPVLPRSSAPLSPRTGAAPRAQEGGGDVSGARVAGAAWWTPAWSFGLLSGGRSEGVRPAGPWLCGGDSAEPLPSPPRSAPSLRGEGGVHGGSLRGAAAEPRAPLGDGDAVIRFPAARRRAPVLSAALFPGEGAGRGGTEFRADTASRSHPSTRSGAAGQGPVSGKTPPRTRSVFSGEGGGRMRSAPGSQGNGLATALRCSQMGSRGPGVSYCRASEDNGTLFQTAPFSVHRLGGAHWVCSGFSVSVSALAHPRLARHLPPPKRICQINSIWPTWPLPPKRVPQTVLLRSLSSKPYRVLPGVLHSAPYTPLFLPSSLFSTRQST